MKDTTNNSSVEIQTREQTKKILHHLQLEETDDARRIITTYKETLRYNFGKPHYRSLIPTIKFSKNIPKNLNALKMVIDTAFDVYSSDNDVEELLFFAAAKCEIQTLQDCLQRISRETLNATREGDTVMMFLIKYGNLCSEQFLECFKMLVESGIDVDKSDYGNNLPVTLLSDLLVLHGKKIKKNYILIENLSQSIALLNTKCTNKESNTDDKVKRLFKFLITKDEESFLKYCAENLDFIDSDDGANTLLQFCCEKNLKVAAKFLVDNQVNVSRTTERNKMQPLEIAARRNNFEIFKSLLDTKKAVIDEDLFRTFVQIRGRQMKTKYFDEILKYDNLDVDLKANNGNTPLHYAILFSNVDAIKTLLRRKASDKTENKHNKSPFCYMDDNLKAILQII